MAQMFLGPGKKKDPALAKDKAASKGLKPSADEVAIQPVVPKVAMDFAEFR
jgi:hypothetical protein